MAVKKLARRIEPAPTKVVKKLAPAPVKSVAKKAPSGNGVVRPGAVVPAPSKAPAKKLVPAKKVAPTKAAPRKPVDDDDDEETGARPPMSSEDIRAGWSASQETIDSTSTWAVTFRPTTNYQVIKVLQAAPYASFRRHWIRRASGTRAYTCLQSFNRDCPLCDVGDKASAVSAFNIALCGDDGEAVLKSWDCTVRVTQTLKTFANDPKVGPLDKRTLYFAVSKTEAQNRQQSQTLISPVRERDLVEDYGVPPLDDAQIERLLEKQYTNEVIQMNKRSELEQVAEEIMNEDESPSRGWSN